MLEKQKKLLRNYTQNIDTLEQVAGIKNVIECHGRILLLLFLIPLYVPFLVVIIVFLFQALLQQHLVLVVVIKLLLILLEKKYLLRKFLCALNAHQGFCRHL